MTRKIRDIADARISVKGSLVVYTHPHGVVINEHTYDSIHPSDTLNAIIDYDCNHDRSAVGMDSFLAIAEDLQTRLRALEGNPSSLAVQAPPSQNPSSVPTTAKRALTGVQQRPTRVAFDL